MISQQLSQRQQLKILPQQIQLLNLYFLNTIELETRMKSEMEENVFLEVTPEEQFDEGTEKPSKDTIKEYQDYEEYAHDDVPDYRTEYQNYFAQETAPQMVIAGTRHFKDDAKEQLRMLPMEDRDHKIAEYLIDVLDNHGLMDKDLDEVADDLSFHLGVMIEVAHVERLLAVIQTLEPFGIGARSVQECLVMQLERFDQKISENRVALRLMRNHYSDLMHRQFEKVQHSLGIDEEILRSVLNLIGTLKFYPVSENASSFQPKNTIIPDFIINRFGDYIQVHLHSTRANSVFVNQSLYDQLSSQTSARDRGAAQYVKSKLAAAQWFVSAVKQREDTMMRIMQTITQIQHEYFQEGDIRLLKPMVLRIVAEKSGLDISTVSRITSNKYADTHFGLIYLKDLFSEGIADQKGEVISNKVIQSVIEEAISGEDKRAPFTDQQLVNILSERGYNIARRTVAKYREQLRIPIAQIRAVWA